MLFKENLRLGELLIANDIISDKQLEQALWQHQKAGEFLGRTVIKMGIASEEEAERSHPENLVREAGGARQEEERRDHREGERPRTPRRRYPRRGSCRRLSLGDAAPPTVSGTPRGRCPHPVGSLAPRWEGSAGAIPQHHP